MANSDKNILITPNKNASGTPQIALTGFGASTISIVPSDGTTGKVNFVSSGSSVFSIDTNINVGNLFDVSNNQNIPIIEISDTKTKIGAAESKVIVRGDGLVLSSVGTTSLPLTSVEGTITYDDNHKTLKVYNGTIWVPVGGLKSGLTADTAAESTEQLIADYPDSPTGFYWILVDNIPYLFWVDMVYEGGGWILVLNNRINTSGMNSLNYSSATQRVVNYRGSYATFPTSRPDSFNLFVGLDAWIKLANANFSSTNRVCEIVAGSYQPLGAVHAHTKRASWNWTGWSGTYAWQGLSGAKIELGGSLPGLYTYHAANGFSLSTFDVDQDANAGNCAAAYSNQPWWYGACWSGSAWGGTGHQDAWYWDSSTTDYHSYGALYVR